MIHIEGFIYDDGDGMRIKNGNTIAERIAYEIEERTKTIEKSRFDIDTGCEDVSLFMPKVSMRAYFSNNECTLEEAEYNQILLSIGALDILQTWYGYSEWTIMGYSVDNFKLISEDGGEHNLEQIFNSYKDKYVHILIDVLTD